MRPRPAPRAAVAAAAAAAFAVAGTGCFGQLTPEGDKHRYVMASVDLPDSPGVAGMFSLDLDGSGRRPNQFGAALAGLGLDTVATVGLKASDDSFLLELQTRDFFDAAASGVAIRFGNLASPPPCRGPNDCGHHVSGSGSFNVAFDSPEEPALFGSIRAGTFLSGLDNELTLLLSIDGLTSIKLPLFAARVQLSQISETRIGKGTIAGGIPTSVLAGRFLDDLQSSSRLPLLESCNFNGASCACLPDTPGSLLQAAFDADGNCNLSRSELIANPAITQMLSADLSINGVPLTSFGMSFVANRASF